MRQPVPTRTPLLAASCFKNTEEYIIYLGKRLIDLKNTKDYQNPQYQDILAPNLYLQIGDVNGSGRDDFIYGYTPTTQTRPNLYIELLNISAAVDEVAGSASAIASVKICGYASGTVKAGMIMCHWIRRQDQWKCCSFHMIYGCPDFG